MMLLTMNKYLSLSLLWGISVLLSMKIESASIPETSSSNSTAEPNKTTTTQPNTSDLPHNETETQHSTQDPFYKHVDLSAVSTDTTVSPTMETQEANVSGQRDDSNVTTTGLVVVNTAAATAIPLILTSASEAQTSHNTMMSETPKSTEDQESPTASAETTAPATTSAFMLTSSAASSATAALSSPQPASTAEPEVTATLSSTTSSDYLTQAPQYIHTLSTPSATTRTTKTTNHTTGEAPVFDSTSLPVRTTETATTSTELPSTSQPISETQTHTSSKVPDTAGPRFTTESPTMSVSTDSAASTTAFSTSPAGGLIHHVPKRMPNITTKSTTTTTAAPCEVSQSSATTEGQTCSIRGVVKHCLITIAVLAGLATIFMVSTIVLCTKLSGKKFKAKKAQHGTEMMCISALLPERNYTYTRQRNPVHNGVLVIPTGGDSDEDGGDNLTLSSFLPENDRIV